MKTAKWVVIFIVLAVVVGCPLLMKNNSTEAKIEAPKTSGFDGAYAVQLVKAQTDFGPRVPGTSAHKKCGDWLVQEFKKSGADVIENTGSAETFDGKKIPVRNIIARFLKDNKERMILSAHWDTRPFTDQDPNPAVQNNPGPGANDGGSGVAVLLEVARNLKLKAPKIGVDLILWDAEDWGGGGSNDSYCLGTQMWAKKPHVLGYTARFGVNLDMVGGAGAIFPAEYYSASQAYPVLEKLYQAAAVAKASAYFVRTPAGSIVDDHYYVMQGTGIKMADVIHLQKNGGFYEYWHTQQDTADKISKDTLEAVGKTMLALIEAEK